MQTWGEGREGASLLIPGKWAVKESWHILIFTSCPEAFGLGPKKVFIVFLPLSLTCWLTWDKSPNLMRPLKTPVPIMKWCANTCNRSPCSIMCWICDTWPFSDKLTLWVQTRSQLLSIPDLGDKRVLGKWRCQSKAAVLVLIDNIPHGSSRSSLTFLVEFFFV